MSHYVMNYSEAFEALRKSVKAARADYLKKIESLKKYEDSEQGKADIEAARADFEVALKAARDIARPKFERAIKGMRERAAAPDMAAPTADMLSILQAMDMRDDIDASEIEAAAKAMGNNDLALKTLRDVLMRKGRVLPASLKTFEAQKHDAINELAQAANSILQWDGRTSAEISSDASRAYHDFRWAGGAPVPANARAAQFVADIEPRSYYIDTAKALIGKGVSTDVVKALE